jgi:hypothetical protein
MSYLLQSRVCGLSGDLSSLLSPTDRYLAANIPVESRLSLLNFMVSATHLRTLTLESSTVDLSDGVHISLIMSKTKLSPIKWRSIPLLKLWH